jgi:hypothetical protein
MTTAALPVSTSMSDRRPSDARGARASEWLGEPDAEQLKRAAGELGSDEDHRQRSSGCGVLCPSVPRPKARALGTFGPAHVLVGSLELGKYDRPR